MKYAVWSISCFFLLLCFGGINLHAQDPWFRSHKNQGLQLELSPEVLLEDRQGQVWVGTAAGLYRYDEDHFVHIVFPDSTPSLHVSALHEDEQGRIWVGHQSGLLAWVEGESLRPFEVEEGHPEQAITGMKTDPAGVLWISTYGEGLYYYRNNRLYNINSDDGLGSDEIYALEIDQEGKLWLGTDQGIFLCWLEDGKKRITPFEHQASLPDQIVRSLHRDREGNLWIGTFDRGICEYHWESKKLRIGSSPANWIYGSTNSIEVVGREVWIGTQRDGLLVLERENLQVLRQYRGISGKRPARIRALHLDGSGNLWIAGGREGLFSLNPFLGQLSVSGLGSAHRIKSVFVDTSQQLWLTSGKHLQAYQQIDGSWNLQQQFVLPGSGAAEIISSCVDAEGMIWLGTFGDGLFRFSPQSGEFKQIGEAHGLTNGSILSMAWQGDRLWLATLGGAFSLMLPKENENMQCEALRSGQGIGANYILQVFPDQQGRVWFTTDGQGVFVQENGVIRPFGEWTGPNAPIIYSMTEDERGNIWFSAQGDGLYRYDGQSLLRIGKAEGLREDDISSVLSDQNGRVLAVHRGGIDLVDIESASLSYWGEESGMETFQPDINAAFREPDGTIWLGSGNSLFRYLPPPPESALQPRLVLQRLSVFLEGSAPLDQEVFSYAQNHLSFAFQGIWYQAPELLSYEYKLEGYDLDWVHTRDRQVTYPKLAPGSYTFRLRTALRQQFSQAEELTHSFVIQRPFWQTIWFYLGLIALLSLLIYAFMRTRERRLHQQARLEQEKIRFQFETLRNQVNPHFLFNSFNTLVAIIEDEPKAAVSYVNHLSDLFRNMLAYREKTLISLKEELVLLENYVFLQQQRYGENLRMEMDISPELMASLLPPLSLQMLIENAIKHNVISRRRPLTIRMFARGDKALVIHNPLQQKRQAAPSTKLGLENIRNRYQLLGAGEIEVIHTESYFEVVVPLVSSV